MKKFIGAAVAVLGLSLGAGASAQILGYQCTVVNSSATRGEFGPVKINFEQGFIQLRTPRTQKVCGEVAHYVPVNGTNFLFNYAVDTETGKTTVAIDGDIVAEANFDSNIGKSSINERWSWTGTKATVGDEVKYTEPQNQIKADTVKADTAGVQFETSAPIQYESIKNLKITDSAGAQIPVIDYTKDRYTITLKTAEPLEKGKAYSVAGNVSDVYGVATDMSADFEVTADGTAVRGGAPKLDSEQEKTLGFEFRSKWYTEPRFTYDYRMSAANFTIGKANDTNPYAKSTDAYYTRLHAAQVSRDNVREGKYSLKWDNHNQYNTVAAFDVPKDWTGANELSFSVYSEKATNETVTMLIYSDSSESKWRDGYSYSFKIDWTGWRDFEIPLSEFNVFNNPAGFNNVSAIYFSSRAFGHNPSPYTVLYLDAIKIGYNPAYPVTPHNLPRTTPEYAHRIPKYDDSYLNHTEPEVTDGVDTAAPFKYSAYYLAERAQQGYFPKYVPGMISFDTNGKAYIRADSTHIQYKNDEGKWEVVDLEDVVRPYVGQIYDTRVWESGASEENVIRFDKQGWAYVLIGAAGEDFLFYSSDGMKTWNGVKLYETVKSLLGSECKAVMFTSARFEHIDGGNTAAAEKPPVILLHQGENCEAYGGYMLIPTKNDRGTLDFSAFRYAQSCISPAYHTGDGNSVVTSGNYAYIVYGDPNDTTTEVGLNGDLSYEANGATYKYKYGVPTYIVKYDMVNKTSERKFLGYAGAKSETLDSDYLTHDTHNWPGIAIDTDGYIHVIMNGHHHPVCYTKSKKAYDITSWEDVSQIGNANIVTSASTKDATKLSHSYGTIMVDKNDNVYVMTRDASRGYRFDTSVYVKTTWTTGFISKTTHTGWVYTPIVQRLTPYYEVARQKISYNPVDDSLYIFYYAQSTYGQYFRDELDAQIFSCPEYERTILMSCDNGEWPYGVSEGIMVNGRYSSYTHASLDDEAAGRDGVLVKAAGVGSGYSGGTAKFKLLQTDDVE